MSTELIPGIASMPTAPALPSKLQIHPISGPVNLDIAVPGSKSITNRYLAMSALADGEVNLTGLLYSDDTVFMVDALRKMGFVAVPDWSAQTCRIGGLGGVIPTAGAEIFVGAAGTVMRFLSAFVTLGKGRFRLDGTARMRQRPIEDLLQSLRQLGVKARSEFNNSCPPVVIDADGLPGGIVQVDGSRSSQYISAMLLAGPYAKSPMTVEVVGEFVSRPFVDLTLEAMSDFGVFAFTDGDRVYRLPHGVKYRKGTYEVEGDATAASYFLAAAAILGGRCSVTNVLGDSPQGDAGFADILMRMGCRVRKGFLPGGKGIEVSRDPKVPLNAIDVDLNDMPDVVLTLAVVCLFAEGRSSIVNVGNLRIKETDRLNALSTELRKLGAEVVEGDDYLEITPGTPKDAEIETYDDHRVAMAMALAGLKRPGVTILQPSCVSKTYPHFFEDLSRLGKAKT